jgi:hypothetical protein
MDNKDYEFSKNKGLGQFHFGVWNTLDPLLCQINPVHTLEFVVKIMAVATLPLWQ